MDERVLNDLQRQLAGRSWLYDDPASHQAGVEDAVTALRTMLADHRGGPSPSSPRGPSPHPRRRAG